MDTNTAIVLVVGLLALVIMGFLWVFRRRGKITVSGPFKTKVEMEGANEPDHPPRTDPGRGLGGGRGPRGRGQDRRRR